MAHEHQYVCDGCGDVVHGKVRGTFYHRDYINIKGQIVLQQEAPKPPHSRIYTYLTHGNRLSDDPSRTQVGEELTFCVKTGMPCFSRFLDRRRGEVEFRRQQKRQDELRLLRKQEMEHEDTSR